MGNQQDLSTFQVFPKLPIEIRYHIWKMHCPALQASTRMFDFIIVEVEGGTSTSTGTTTSEPYHYADPSTLPTCTERIRSVLSVSSESRHFALTYVPDTFVFLTMCGESFDNPKVGVLRYNAKRDIMGLSLYRNWMPVLSDCTWLTKELADELKASETAVRNVAGKFQKSSPLASLTEDVTNALRGLRRYPNLSRIYHYISLNHAWLLAERCETILSGDETTAATPKSLGWLESRSAQRIVLRLSLRKESRCFPAVESKEHVTSPEALTAELLVRLISALLPGREIRLSPMIAYSYNSAGEKDAMFGPLAQAGVDLIVVEKLGLVNDGRGVYDQRAHWSPDVGSETSIEFEN